MNSMNTCAHAKPYEQMFIAALFILAKNWKQSNTLQRVNGETNYVILLSNQKGMNY